LRRRSLYALIALYAFVCAGCALFQPYPPTPTPDYPRLETEVALKLGATITAMAPTPTLTVTPSPTVLPPTPTFTPTTTPSPTPTERPPAPALAFVRRHPDTLVENLVLRAPGTDEDVALTRFVEPLGMSDLCWSGGGEWLAFVSTHDYIHSRDGERNVYLLRVDGTDLHMATGGYIDPEEAAPPYAALQGRVISRTGTCLVCAQGAPGVVEAAADGSFELSGVPVSAQWARAVCQSDEGIWQGDVDLLPEGDGLAPVEIAVLPQGRGWRQASLSPDGMRLAGTTYQWTLDPTGERQYVLEGAIVDLNAGTTITMELPVETTLMGVAWSPDGETIAGGLSGEDATWLWSWDAAGRSEGALLEIANPEQELLTIANPTWAPTGNRIAFELRHWYWWGEHTYRSELAMLDLTAEEPEATVLIASDWGRDLLHPSWSGDGQRIYYQLSVGAPEQDHLSKDNGDIWVLWVGRDDPVPITWDDGAFLPAAPPVGLD